MLKLGYNEATCKENSTVENDLLLCEKYGYDYIELRLDMLQDYLKTHTTDDLKAFFAKSHIKPFAFNSIEKHQLLHAGGVGKARRAVHLRLQGGTADRQSVYHRGADCHQ